MAKADKSGLSISVAVWSAKFVVELSYIAFFGWIREIDRHSSKTTVGLYARSVETS